MNKKQKDDAAFIEKIKSLSISTGGTKGQSEEPKCPGCGGGIDEHEIKIVGFGVGVVRRREAKPKHDETHEEAFSA